MTTHAEGFAVAVAIGVGATAIMDLWGVLQKRLFGMQPLDYALIGRWLGHLVQGRARHAAIASSPPVAGERVIGWVAHYARVWSLQAVCWLSGA